MQNHLVEVASEEREHTKFYALAYQLMGGALVLMQILAMLYTN